MRNFGIFLGVLIMASPLIYVAYLFIVTIFFNPGGVPYYGQ